MIFSTTLFLFLFLPLFLIGYYALPFRARTAWILLGSWVFYGWWRLDFLALLGASTVWTYLLGGVVARHREQGRRAYRALWVGVALNLGILGYFKYFNFGVDTLNALLGAVGVSPWQAWQVILPIGISFYVFQATSYLVDVWRGDAPPAANYLELAAYISLFPQLIAGPILRYKDLAAQFRHRDHRFDAFADGAYRFMIGFCRKVLIADTVAVIADAAFALPHPGFTAAWLGALAYTVQLYFDFTGYSDMAIGLGLMMGFRFMENFNYPYISRSITEFWRRWHISLSTWLRDYLYIPLGGNRGTTARTYRNIALVMLLGGLWHGAAWTFVIWGAWHGTILVLERWRGRRGASRSDQRDPGTSLDGRGRLWAIATTARTMLIVVAGWVVFRAPDVSSAIAIYRGMVGLNGSGAFSLVALQASGLSLVTLMVAFAIIYTEPFLHRWMGRVPVHVSPAVRMVRVGTAALFVLAVIKLQAEAFSPFLYFQF
ncbi:MAG: MBOAT family protein [Spirochaetaceae bacterium]|nr:MAG: MBOAT family protein [Spirochaetaceae bacterium]